MNRAAGSGFPDALIGDWIPYQLVKREQQWLCRWLALGGRRFTEPFFSETIQQCKSHGRNANRFDSLSSLDCLAAQTAGPLDAVTPSAFIFHVSRCGSTLLSQLLGLSQRAIVLSEVPLIDQLLRLPLKDGNVAPAEMEAALQASIAWLGRKKSGNETHLFVKLDSWHVFFAATIRKLYPEVPFVLLYRSPDEVLRSHQKRRGMHAVPGFIEPVLFGMSSEDLDGIDCDVYTGQVLTYYFSRFLAIAAQDGQSLLLNYQEGGMPLLQQLAACSGIVFNDTEREHMEARSRTHSKYPDQIFSEERPQLPEPAHLAPAFALYRSLEAMRGTVI
jgi:hypothetical protein